MTTTPDRRRPIHGHRPASELRTGLLADAAALVAKLTAVAEQLQAAADPEAAEAQIEAVQAEAIAQVADARSGLAHEAQRRQQAEADAEEARAGWPVKDYSRPGPPPRRGAASAAPPPHEPGGLLFAAMVIAALVVSIAAAAGTLGAVWYTRRSARSAEASAAAAEKAAAAAEKTAALDAERRHAELTPEFEIACTAEQNGISDQGELTVTLTGPDGLDRLDEVTIVILDESGADHWAHGYPTGVSEDDARRFVWGPWEFNTGASSQVTDNRTTRPQPYSRADGRNWDRLSLARTRPGRWMSMDQERWQKQVDGPVRLQITTRRGTEQWILLREVETRI